MDVSSPKLYLYLSNNNNRFVWLWASILSRSQFLEISLYFLSESLEAILIN